MSLWIKICGMTSAAAVHTAIEAGVNAVGFVFAPSKRQVTSQQAIDYSMHVPSHIARIAVMLHPSQALVDEVLNGFKPDVLQTDWEDLAGLSVPSQLQVLPVLRATRQLPVTLPKRFLFEGPASGTGETADWIQAAQLATQGELVLAGGLNPSNVTDAIGNVRPYGVDVSSGVESSPGVKDVNKIVEFVNAARSAGFVAGAAR
ncbi:MAG TPA: phosphoribosylanthranilate isomerase [Steroidobacteraceae bacterium]|nr:phosphoribosylanthranilate isomerase [Steroidobacteraceae bacterium]